MMFPETWTDGRLMLETLRQVLTDPFWGFIYIIPPNEASLKELMAAMLGQAHVQSVLVAAIPMILQNILLSATDVPMRQAAVERTNKLGDYAYFFHCNIMMIASGKDPGPEHRDRAKVALKRSTIEPCRYAEEKALDYNLYLDIVNFDRNIHRKFVIGPTEEAIEIVKEVREEVSNFGLCLDMNHVALLGESFAHAWEIAQLYVVETYLANCTFRDPNDPLYGDNHPQFGYPGSEYDVPQLVAYL